MLNFSSQCWKSLNCAQLPNNGGPRRLVDNILKYVKQNMIKQSTLVRILVFNFIK